MAKKTNVGVIGVGKLGGLHAKMFAGIEACELVGVFDANPERAAEVAKAYGTKAFVTLDELLDEVEAVTVAAPTQRHYEIALAAFAKNRHVFVEKPIAASISQAEEMALQAREKRLVLQVGHIERFNPALLSLQGYPLEPKFIQTDRLAQFNPRGADVPVVLDLMIHDIDVILNLVKSEVKRVSANGVNVVTDSIDIANARVEFENGAVANVTASRISNKKMRKMRLFQKDAYVTLDFVSGVSEIYRLADPSEKAAGAIQFGEMGEGERRKLVVYEQPTPVEVNALMREMELFVECVAKGEPPVVSGEDGLRALKVADQIVRKIEESLADIT
ncbi:MAG: gfo/Idh/MocA family oxidoreductase [Ignavibacteriales bacterium]|nr:gfo/Idh/MocA family oxidoreductase [Ignavibacteriales bacterium]